MSLTRKYPVPRSAITEKGLKKLLKKTAEEFGTHRSWAEAHGITPQSVSAFLKGTQGAGLQIPDVLGYRPQVVYLPLREDPIAKTNKPRRRKVEAPKRPDLSAHRKAKG